MMSELHEFRNFRPTNIGGEEQHTTCTHPRVGGVQESFTSHTILPLLCKRMNIEDKQKKTTKWKSMRETHFGWRRMHALSLHKFINLIVEMCDSNEHFEYFFFPLVFKLPCS